MSILDNVKKIHFVGIGGSGMYPIVQILASRGYVISGSDVLEGDIINYERNMGIKVNIPQFGDLIGAVPYLAVFVTIITLAITNTIKTKKGNVAEQ